MKRFQNSFSNISDYVNKNKTYKIEIFVTNIQNTTQKEKIKEELLIKYPELILDFDLEDVDKVLRVEGFFNPTEIIEIIVSINFECKIML